MFFFYIQVIPGISLIERIRPPTRLRLPLSSAPFEKVDNASIYIYSAIWREGTNVSSGANTTYMSPSVILSGWQLPKLSNMTFRCCFLLRNGNIMTSNWTFSRRSWKWGGGRTLQATRFVCETYLDPLRIKGVGLSIGNFSDCSKNISQYRELTILPNNINIQNGIAICSKIAYGSLGAKKLVEWFETQLYLGVQKVISYSYDLNKDALNVLKYYEKLGIVDILPFGFPQSGTLRM